MRIVLPILHYTEESNLKEDLGLINNRNDFTYRDMIFYRIDVVGDDLEDGIPTGGAVINSGGELYITSLSKEEVDAKIQRL